MKTAQGWVDELKHSDGWTDQNKKDFVKCIQRDTLDEAVRIVSEYSHPFNSSDVCVPIQIKLQKLIGAIDKQ